MTTIRTVTQEEMAQKFSAFSRALLGKDIEQSHVAIVSDRIPSKISVIDNDSFLSVLREKGFSMPTDMNDIAVISVVGNTQKNTTGKKMKR